jgi:hypothetical protein
VTSAVDTTIESVVEIVEAGRILAGTTRENANEVVDLVDGSADVAVAIGQETWADLVDYGTREMDSLTETGKQKATFIRRSNAQLAEDRWEAGLEKTAEFGRGWSRFPREPPCGERFLTALR